MTEPHGTRIDWSAGTWTHAPVSAVERGEDLLVTAVETSDAWRHTAYGFVHDTEHALLAPFTAGTAVEVVFTADFTGEFDQAGVFVRVDDERWIKAGLEYAEGSLGAGAVVTDVRSDWSVGAVPEWQGKRIRVRVSWNLGALIVRAGIDGEELRLLRVLPFDETLTASAGPYVCAPTRSDLTVALHEWRTAPADTAVH